MLVSGPETALGVRLLNRTMAPAAAQRGIGRRLDPPELTVSQSGQPRKCSTPASSNAKAMTPSTSFTVASFGGRRAQRAARSSQRRFTALSPR